MKTCNVFIGLSSKTFEYAVSENMVNSPLTKAQSAPLTVSTATLCSAVKSIPHTALLSSITSDVQIESVARYFGGNGYKPDPATTKRIDNSIVLASQLVNPEVTYTLFPIARIFPGREILLESGLKLHVPDCFTDSGAVCVAAVIGTLGDRLEKQCRELAGSGQIYESTLLDAVGTTFLDLLGDKLSSSIHEAGREVGLERGDRFSPGIDGYPLEQQRQLFEMADCGSVGVGLNSSNIMVPTKSISFFMILTTTPIKNSDKDKCSVCKLSRCQFRKAAARDTTARPIQ